MESAEVVRQASKNIAQESHGGGDNGKAEEGWSPSTF